MSKRKQGKREVDPKRQLATEEIGDGMRTVESTIPAYAVIRDKDGYRTIEMELPESVVESHHTKVHEPDILEFAVGKVEDGVRRRFWEQ